ncbi:MAG: bifunctional diguanylate cyclase/phosphodiesterase, partial [Planctomycetota bacterium]
VLFRDRVERSVAQYHRNNARKFAVLYMDVNDFKLINDNYGHGVGDDFLVALANRLHGGLRSSDAILARLGGDEFAVLLENVDSIEHAIAVATRLAEKMKAPFPIGEHEFCSGVSIGIAMCSSSNANLDTIISEADTAMYYCKRQSDMPYSVFNSQMLTESVERLELSGELRQAVYRNELVVKFQPIVDLQSKEIQAFEALTRWQHPLHGEILPERFMPIAESSGILLELSCWEIETACKNLADWKSTSSLPVKLNINVGLKLLQIPSYVESLNNCIQQHDLSADQIKLELTESQLSQMPAEAFETLKKLDGLGFEIVLDDFGLGYSSLFQIHHLRLSMLKIASSIICDLHSSSEKKAIVKSIQALANSLDIDVVAEGVSNAEQIDLLLDAGCSFGQGSYLGIPQEAEDLFASDRELSSRTAVG